MRRANLVLSSLVCAAVLAAGCDRGAPTATPDASPVFGIGNAPSQSGPNVVRFETIYGLFLTDPERGLQAVYAFDPVQFCQGNPAFEIVNIQNVSVPEDANRINQLVQGDDLTTSVWPFTAFDCGLFTTVAPLATGVTDLVTTDNDLLTFLNPDSRNANAFGFMARGRLTLADGRTSQYNGITRCVWDGNDPTSLNCTDQIHLARP